MVTSLRAADVERLTSALDEIAQAPDLESFPILALKTASAVVPNDVAAYNAVTPSGTAVVWWPEGAYRPVNTPEMFSRYRMEHPLLTFTMRTGDGSPRAISDFMEPEDFERTNLFRLIYGPMGLADQMALTLPAPAPMVIGIALNRKRRGFNERERLLANLLRPYLIQAHHSLRLAAALAATSALTLDNRVAVAVARDGRVEPVTGSFPDWFPAWDLFPGAYLDEETFAWFAAQLSPDADAGLPPLARPLAHRALGRVWVMRHVPTRVGPVIVVTRGREGEHEERAVLRSLGLTDREALALHLISRGATNSDIAQVMAISTSGVKRHVESLFRKLGVRNRSEAAALAIDTIAHG